MSWKQYLPFTTPWHERVEKGLRQRLGDADALLLIPYDDGTHWLKPAYYDKSLVGGIGGYETPDEDKFVVDGTGNAVRDLFGVPIALAIDPSEHAATVEPIKALVAQKDNLGEWVRVDRDDAVVQAGDALEPVANGGVQAKRSEALQKEMGNMEKPDMHEALLNLAENGEIRKLYDLTPKRRVTRRDVVETEVVDEDIEMDADAENVEIEMPEDVDAVNTETTYEVEEATGYIVDQSKAADLLPNKWTTEKLQIMQDKARMQEYDEGKLMRYAGYGLIAGFMLSLLALGVFWFLGQIGGGVF